MKLVRLLRLMGSSLIPYLFGIILMTVSVRLFSVIKSLVVKDVFNMFDKGTGSLFDIVIKNLILGGICLVVYVFTSYIYKVESKKGHMNLRLNVFSKILRLPMSYFENNSKGDIISGFFFDTSQATDVYTAKLRRFCAPLISIVVYIIPMIIMNVPLTFCLVCANIIAVFANRFFAARIKLVKEQISSQNGKMTDSINNIISGVDIVKIFGIGKILSDKYIKLNNEFADMEKSESRINSQIESTNTFFDFMCSILFLCLGVFFVSKGIASISSLAAIYVLYSDFSSQFLLVCKYYPELMGCLVSAGKVFNILDKEEEKEAEAVEDIYSKYAVELKNITFRYEDREILKNFSMSVENNCITALTGPSGKGKSTVAKLISGFYQPEKGGIYIKGKSIYTLGLNKLRELIAYVPQDCYIFNVSIEENIAYGNINASKDDIINASKLANAHSFITEKQEGYKTIAGERGNKLSGGEKQRIAIARAILKNSPIILFDEATSALDYDNEMNITENIKALGNDKTIIMIAHRPATIESCDRVIEI